MKTGKDCAAWDVVVASTRAAGCGREVCWPREAGTGVQGPSLFADFAVTALL